MVKAIKRKVDALVAPVKKKERTNRVKIVTLIALALMVMGWTVGSYFGFGASNDRAQPATEPKPQFEYGVCSFVETKEGTIGNLTENHAVFVQLTMATDLNKRLKGELYSVGAQNILASVTQIIFTNASFEKITSEAKGEFIAYTIADCGTFNCLVQNQTNGTALFDVYQLNKTSSFIKTNRIGLPSVAEGLTI